MFKKKNNIEKTEDTVVEIVKTPKKETSFSVFQVVIFAFLFILMIWIIGFLSLELDNQKRQVALLASKVDNMEKGGVELLETYIEKIRDLQKVDIKEQVQQFGMDIKENISKVRELMFDKDDLAKLDSKITALENYNKTYKGINLLMLTSATLLRDAINRGDSFKVELDTLMEVAGKDKVVKDAEVVLLPYAENGIKTLSELRNDFEKISDDIVFMANNPDGEGDNVRQRFLFRVKGLLKVRKVDFENPIEEEKTPDFIVAETEKYLRKGNLVEAVAEFEKLKDISEAGFNFAKKWYDNAKVKISVDEIISPVLKVALEKALHDVEVKKVPVKKKVFAVSEESIVDVK
ncbi:MAG: hypothetical protein K6F04_00610 [bacterium]|nr:hypothetical protein [bacterium]